MLFTPLTDDIQEKFETSFTVSQKAWMDEYENHGLTQNVPMITDADEDSSSAEPIQKEPRKRRRSSTSVSDDEETESPKKKKQKTKHVSQNSPSPANPRLSDEENNYFVDDGSFDTSPAPSAPVSASIASFPNQDQSQADYSHLGFAPMQE